MLGKYRHVSFDLDGTLVHTIAEYRYRITPEVVAALGGRKPSEAAIDRFWFEASRDTVIRNEFGLDPAVFWDPFHEADLLERAKYTYAYEDAERTLRRLKTVGKIISIITGSPHYVATTEIERLNGAPFDCFFSIFDNTFPEKPNPASFHLVLERLHTTSHETVYIGNSNEDALYARNVGVDFIYLERKEHQFDLRDIAKATIHSLDELFIKHLEANLPSVGIM